MGLIERMKALAEDKVPAETEVSATYGEIREAFAQVFEGAQSQGWQEGWYDSDTPLPGGGFRVGPNPWKEEN